MALEHNYPLQTLNTFGLSAQAEYFARFQSIEELQNLSSYDFSKAKKELNWQNESQILEGVFSPFLDKA